MKTQRAFESFATTINERDNGLGKTGDRCFHIGSSGGCCLRCAAFCDGECNSPYEFSASDVADEFDAEEFRQILEFYPGFATPIAPPKP